MPLTEIEQNCHLTNKEPVKTILEVRRCLNSFGLLEDPRSRRYLCSNFCRYNESREETKRMKNLIDIADLILSEPSGAETIQIYW